MQSKNNAVIYARYSSVGQNEQSIEGQVRICKEFAQQKGINIVKVYMDKARTGTNDNRPEFQKMIAEASSGAYQYIIVYMFDRFARNRMDSIVHKTQLREQHDIKVLSALEPVSDDEGGEFYEMYLEWSAEKYSKRLSKRVRDGLDTSVANGTFCGGSLIMGYKLHKEPIAGKAGKFIHKVVVDDEYADIIKYVFTEYDNGVEKIDIAKALNEKGYLFNGKQFKGRSFDKWLKNRKYTGEFNFGDRQCNNMYPALIDTQLFNRVQERLQRNKYFSGANTAKEHYSLTGKAFCGHCETAVVSDGGTSKTGATYHYYACKKAKKSQCDKKRENKNALELLVATRAVNYLSDPKRVEKLAEDIVAYHEQRTGNDNLKSVDVRIQKTKQEVQKLTTAFIEAKSNLLRYNIEKQMIVLESLLADLSVQKAQLELERDCRVSKHDIQEYIAQLIKGDINDKEHQRLLIDNLVNLVYIFDGLIAIFFSLQNGKETQHIPLNDIKEALNGETQTKKSSNLNTCTPPKLGTSFGVPFLLHWISRLGKWREGVRNTVVVLIAVAVPIWSMSPQKAQKNIS